MSGGLQPVLQAAVSNGLSLDDTPERTAMGERRRDRTFPHGGLAG